MTSVVGEERSRTGYSFVVSSPAPRQADPELATPPAKRTRAAAQVEMQAIPKAPVTPPGSETRTPRTSPRTRARQIATAYAAFRADNGKSVASLVLPEQPAAVDAKLVGLPALESHFKTCAQWLELHHAKTADIAEGVGWLEVATNVDPRAEWLEADELPKVGKIKYVVLNNRLFFIEWPTDPHENVATVAVLKLGTQLDEDQFLEPTSVQFVFGPNGGSIHKPDAAVKARNPGIIFRGVNQPKPKPLLVVEVEKSHRSFPQIQALVDEYQNHTDLLYFIYIRIGPTTRHLNQLIALSAVIYARNPPGTAYPNAGAASPPRGQLRPWHVIDFGTEATDAVLFRNMTAGVPPNEVERLILPPAAIARLNPLAVPAPWLAYAGASLNGARGPCIKIPYADLAQGPPDAMQGAAIHITLPLWPMLCGLLIAAL